MSLRWVGPPPTPAQLAALRRLARSGKLPKHGTVTCRVMTRAQIAKTAQAFERFHWGEKPKRVKRTRLPAFSEGLFELGQLRAVEYETTKGGERAVWVHKFSKPYPSLTGTARGKLGPIVGGGAFITERGIER